MGRVREYHSRQPPQISSRTASRWRRSPRWHWQKTWTCKIKPGKSDYWRISAPSGSRLISAARYLGD